jgi:two-component system sensor histidine kinase KdpD
VGNSSRIWKRVLYRGAIGGASVFFLTYVSFHLNVNQSSAGFLYLLLVVIIALRLGFAAATVTSLLAVNCLNYYFVQPILTFRIANPEDWVALVTFEFTALVVSRLSTQVQEQARIARLQSSDRQKLYQLSRGVLLMDQERPVGSQVLALIQATLSTRSAALFDGTHAKSYTIGTMTTELESSVREAYAEHRDENNPAHGRWSRVLALGGKPIGAIALRSADLNSEVVDAVASVAAIAIERSQSLERAARAETARHSEQLRSAVLDSLAHAFKTPLTTILAASSGLLETGLLHGPELDLVTLIDQEAERLNNLATQLLRTARLDEAKKRPVENCDLSDIVHRVLQDLSWELSGRPVTTNLPAAIAKVRGDRELITMGITQFVDNAAKYSTPGSVITISAESRGKETVMSVHNVGPVIVPEDRERIFERFYRGQGSEHLAAGTGIGLSVAKRAAEAHGGRAWVESEEGEGTTFYLSLPNTPQQSLAPANGLHARAALEQADRESDYENGRKAAGSR